MNIKDKIRNKKNLSVFLSAVLAVNTCAMIKVSTYGSGSPDSEELRNDIVDRAYAYLDSKIASDKSIGDSSTINDTAYALKAYRKAEKGGHNDSLKWLADNVSFSNTDMTSRLASASGDQEYLGKLEVKQNPDGGFGLYPDYESDVFDTVLVLEAINETGYSGTDVSAEDVCSYLMRSANPDGGYSYADSNVSDPELTGIVVYNVGKYLSMTDGDMSQLDAPLSYLSGTVNDSYTDSAIDTTLYKYLAYQATGTEFDPGSIVSELGDAEKTDGSFAGRVRTTSLAIELISDFDLKNSVNVSSFRTKLSTDSTKAGNAAPIKATTTIAYKSSYDAEFNLRFTVYSDDNPIYENVTKVALPTSETTKELEAGEFRINEPGKEVYAVAELLKGDIIVKSQRLNLEVTKDDAVYSTELTKLGVDTDKYVAFTGTNAEVSATPELLYTTNIKRDATIVTKIIKDGKEEASRTDAVVLLPEKNSVSPEPLKFKADTSKPSKYTIKSVCIYNGKEILQGESEFNVIKAPVIEGTPEDGVASQFEVTWFGPILSNYYVYAGNEKEISAGAEINYYSNGKFNGKVELGVYSGDELITETSFDVELEKGVPTYYEGKAEFPVYKNEDQLAFTVKKAGEYTVTGKLYDSAGNLLKENKRKVTVVDKPVQSLVMNSSVAADQDNMVNISWNDISNDAESYSYQLNRRTNGGKWEPRSIWNEEEHIKVLNVYPRDPYLVEWMNTTISDTETPAGKGIFNIEPVHISTFNNDPEKYLYNDDGSWKCDVIFFGSADCNGNIDLSTKAMPELQKFIDSGRGVLFGHDTIWQRNFNTFADQAGLWVGPNNVYRTTSVSVVKVGTLTNYPWVIRGDLTVPNTHTSGQYIKDAIEWITLNNTKRTDPDTGYTDGFYLATKNNLGMIQTGDSTGQATDDERKVLANTLFYLYQISQQTTAKDASFYDVDAPDKPSFISSEYKNGKANVKVKSTDHATTYDYYITATPESPDSDSVLSNVRSHTVLSGLAGFVIKVSGSSDPDPDLLEYNEKRDQILDIVPADGTGTASLSAEPTDFIQPQFIHIFAIDKAGNVSEEYIMPFAEDDVKTKIITDKKVYSYGDKVTIDADTLAELFGRTADVKIVITDEAGMTAAELVSEKDKTLAAGEKVENETEWIIPTETVGRYKAVISWMNGDEVIAEDETVFRIANEKSVVNTIVSDKQTYLEGEPVNLDSRVFNESAAMTENEVRLLVTVYRTDDNTEVASYEHNIGMVEPSDDISYHDALEPEKLTSGKHVAKAVVLQDETVLSEDEAEFEVTANVASISGTLDLNGSDGKGTVEATVKNSGSTDLENVEISIIAYKEGSDNAVYTFKKTVDIMAGETISIRETFDLPEPSDGRYSGVLKAVYNGETSDLDYDGFELAPPAVETTETITETTTAAVEDSPKTGDKRIPAYMWLISIFSLAGLVVLKMTGGSNNEN